MDAKSLVDEAEQLDPKIAASVVFEAVGNVAQCFVQDSGVDSASISVVATAKGFEFAWGYEKGGIKWEFKQDAGSSVLRVFAAMGDYLKNREKYDG